MSMSPLSPKAGLVFCFCAVYSSFRRVRKRVMLEVEALEMVVEGFMKVKTDVK
jgi:hypothetical protein